MLLLVTERYFFEVDNFLKKTEFEEFIKKITKKDFVPLTIKIKCFNQYRLEMLEFIHKKLNDFLEKLDDRRKKLREYLTISS